jgi:hypothetical protein
MKTIIEMAEEVGALGYVRDSGGKPHLWIFTPKELERFATLVIANHPPQSFMTWQEGCEAGKQAEREVCAKDKRDAERYRHMRNNAQFQSRNGPGLYWYLPRFGNDDEGQQLDDAIDAAIRARGQA